MKGILSTRAKETSCLAVFCLPAAGQTHFSQDVTADWVAIESASLISAALILTPALWSELGLFHL